MHTCGIIEDEYLAQRLLVKYIKRFAGLKIVWSFETVLKPISLPQVDIVFLDLLDSPSNDYLISEGINEFTAYFSTVIITTAYPRKYITELGLHNAGVLTKPYTYRDFEQVLTGVIKNL